MTDEDHKKRYPEQHPDITPLPAWSKSVKTGRNNLPKVFITQKALDALPEYSCSMPTGVYIGKTWKRDINAYSQVRGEGKKEPNWCICRFERIPGDDTQVKNAWYDVEVTA